ncbi:MAG: hypothetical protein WAO21_11495 [Verrucomicrobiia bacterium]
MNIKIIKVCLVVTGVLLLVGGIVRLARDFADSYRASASEHISVSTFHFSNTGWELCFVGLFLSIVSPIVLRRKK